MPEQFEDDGTELPQAGPAPLGPIDSQQRAGLAVQKLTLGDKFGMLSTEVQLLTAATANTQNVKFRDPQEKLLLDASAALDAFVKVHAADEEV